MSFVYVCVPVQMLAVEKSKSITSPLRLNGEINVKPFSLLLNVFQSVAERRPSATTPSLVGINNVNVDVVLS
jgi:hypothetical protein